ESRGLTACPGGCDTFLTKPGCVARKGGMTHGTSSKKDELIGLTNPDVPPNSRINTHPKISIAHVLRSKLIVAHIIEAKRSKKFPFLSVNLDIGNAQTCQVIANLGYKYQPDALQGRLVIFVKNLITQRRDGSSSKGTILAIHQSGSD